MNDAPERPPLEEMARNPHAHPFTRNDLQPVARYARHLEERIRQLEAELAVVDGRASFIHHVPQNRTP